jgi:hypothetical protein
VLPKLLHTRLDRLIHQLELFRPVRGALPWSISFLLEKTTRSDPDLMAGGYGLARLVENGFGLFGRLETRECEPKFYRLWYDFDGTAEEDASVNGGCFEVDSLFP